MAQSILVVSKDTDLVPRLREVLASSGYPGVRLDRAPSGVLALRILTGSSKEISAIVLDLAKNDEALAFLQDLDAAGVAAPVFAAALDGAWAAESAAVVNRCGVFQRIEQLPRLIAASGALGAPRNAARLVLFAPAQEGAGASAAALHTAYILAREHRLRTLFAELDYHSDSVACRLRITNPKSLADLESADGDWRSVISEWNGLHVLVAPNSARILRKRGLPDLRRVLDDSGRDYDIVVGDLPCNTTVVAPEVLSVAQRIYVVATAEVTSLYLARRRILELGTAGANPRAIQLIINRDRPGAVDSELANRVTGLNPVCRLPNDFVAASEAETEGRTVDRGSALGQAYERLAADILGKAAPARVQPPKRWSRLLTAWR